jgi:hypothetical protein
LLSNIPKPLSKVVTEEISRPAPEAARIFTDANDPNPPVEITPQRDV